MSEHTVTSSDDDLRTLRLRVSEMGGNAETMLAGAVDSLTRHDIELSQEVIGSDARLDQLQREIEEYAIITIARRQPMANDLREMICAMRIGGDLERIGDLAKNISKRVFEISPDTQMAQLLLNIELLSGLAKKQLKDVLEAYRDGDAVKAHDVWTRDASIDALYTSLFRECLTYMMEDVRRISFCTHFLFCAKNIERVGDHTTNIAEAIHYLVTGQMLAIDRPKATGSSPLAAAEA